MTTLKQAAELLAKLARDESVDPDTLRSVSAALSKRLDALSAPGARLDELTLAGGEPARPKPFRIDRSQSAVRPVQERHVAALERAGVGEADFEAALAALLSDKAVTVKVLRAVAADYSGTPVTSRTTRAEAERMIRQAFARRQWQHEAYRRIDNLNAAR